MAIKQTDLEEFNKTIEQRKKLEQLKKLTAQDPKANQVPLTDSKQLDDLRSFRENPGLTKAVPSTYQRLSDFITTYIGEPDPYEDYPYDDGWKCTLF